MNGFFENKDFIFDVLQFLSNASVLVLLLTSSAIAVGIKKIMHNRNERRRKLREAVVKIESANMLLLKHQLIDDCKEAIRKDKISLDKLTNINENYETYHALGGNGTVTALVDRVNKLKIDERDDENG